MSAPTFCTIGPSATTRERCGEPAVHTFTGTDGVTVFAECAKHSTAHIAIRTTNPRAIGDHVTVRRYGKEYDAVVTRTRAFATFTYGNGAERTVEV